MCVDLLSDLCWCYVGSVFFFFQAEDGIRDLVRSRGLGDVYKRQSPDLWKKMADLGWHGLQIPEDNGGSGFSFLDLCAVSYTHLTLPTSDLV